MSFLDYLTNKKWVDMDVLLGKTLIEVDVSKGEDDDHIIFTSSDGVRYCMYHSQDCCEEVTIEDICGDTDWLLNSPITVAEEITNVNEPPIGGAESYTWTFYRIGTIKGVVTIRWFGASNGYYSESVDFVQME